MYYTAWTLLVELQLTLRSFQGDTLGCLSSFQHVSKRPRQPEAAAGHSHVGLLGNTPALGSSDLTAF